MKGAREREQGTGAGTVGVYRRSDGASGYIKPVAGHVCIWTLVLDHIFPGAASLIPALVLSDSKAML